ncbi:DUF11 domain-containing protein, partial [Patescibacteria group bacterium]|nr:DUF11 domain-containing protein [Patescibacteria group bacterium]
MSTKKILSAITLTAMLAIDLNAGGLFTIFAPENSVAFAAGSTRSWSADTTGIRSFVNQKARELGLTEIPTDFDGQGMVSNDARTAQKVCELAGYQTVTYRDCYEYGGNSGRCNFTSCGDNVIGSWSNSSDDFELSNSCGNTWLASLTCSDPITEETSFECSDGIDNDGNRKIDALTTGTAGGGDFAIESANPKYGKTWIASITCRASNGSTTKIGGTGNPEIVLDAVSAAIKQKGLPFKKPTTPLVRTDGGSGQGNSWNDGTPHTPTLNAVCNILGYDSYVSSTCNDNERSGLYPNGKCNFDTPNDNQHFRFTGTISLPSCSDGKDNDNDGETDYPADKGCENENDTSEVSHDPDCDSPTDPTESATECDDGIDNDGDGETDYPDDPGCDDRDDDSERDPNGPECDNGKDDDSDGETDYPDDPDCTDPNDDDEESEDTTLTLVKEKTRPDVLKAGEQKLRYLITMTNTGNATAHETIVVDPIPVPQYLTFRPTPLSSPACEQEGSNIVCKVLSKVKRGELEAGDSHTFRIVFEVSDNIPCDTVVSNSATIESDNSPTTTSNTITDQVFCEQLPECSDGEDNDNDGAIDYPDDFSCTSDDDDDESNPLAACQDGRDNDGDGLTDYPQDPGCYSLQDDDERDANGPECDNGFDDDSDGETDFPDDPGCDDPYDDDERETECSDGIDNDGDGATDFPDDFSCTSPDDDDESNLLAACQDGYDNDGDGLTDFPDDPGCYSEQDDDERDANGPECDNGLDDDNDNETDYPDDPECDDPYDDSEQAQADLKMISKTGPRDALLGETVVYSIKVKNLGPDQATNVVVADVVPFGLVFNALSSDSECVLNGNSVLCNNFNLNRNQTKTFSVAFDVVSNNLCSQEVINEATVSTSSLDPNSNNNSKSASTDITCPPPPECSDGIDNDGDGAIDYPADFSCTSPNDDDESNPLADCQDGYDNDGDGLTDYPQDPGCYSLQDDDERDANGPECDNGLDDDNDNETDFPDDPGCDDPYDDDERNAECSDGIDNDLDGATDFPDDFSCTSPDDDDESNLLAACQDGYDNDGDHLIDFPADPGCSSEQDNDEFNLLYSDLSVVKSGVVSIQRGNTLLYTITVSNHGPDTARNVVTGDWIPSGLTFNPALSDVDCVLDGAKVLCNNLDLASGGHHTYQVAFNVPTTYTCNATIQNSVHVSTSSTDPNPSNNVYGPISTTVTCTQCSDGVDNDGDGAIDYPADFSCTSPNDDDESNPLAACQDGRDNDGDHLIDYPQDPGCNSKQDNDETNASLGADLSIIKSGPVTIQHGQTALYTLSVFNNGPETATNVVAADVVPNGMTFNPILSDPACILQAGDVLCNNLNLTNGSSKSYTVAFNVTGVSCGASVQNTATVSASSTDLNPANNTSSILTTVQCTQCSDGVDNDGDGAIDYPADFSCTSPNDDDESGPLAQCQDGIDNDGDHLIDYPQDPGCNSKQDNDEINILMSDLSITKTGPATVVQGSTVSYNLIVTNNGPDLANNVVASDTIPTGLTFNASASSVECIKQGNDILCNNLSLTNSASRSYTIVFDVPATVACNAVILNAASVSTSSTDFNPLNNQSVVVQTNVTCVQTYQCSDGIDNDGDNLIDFPADPGCSSALDNDETDPVVTYQCNDGIDNDGDNLIDFPADPGCSSALDNDEINILMSDLSITKTGPATVVQGSTVSYNLIVTNNGPDLANNVVASDT